MEDVQIRNECMIKCVSNESKSSDISSKSLGKTTTESFVGDLFGKNSSFNSKRQAGYQVESTKSNQKCRFQIDFMDLPILN